MEIFHSEFNPDSMFDRALPSLKLNTEGKVVLKVEQPTGQKNKLRDILKDDDEEVLETLGIEPPVRRSNRSLDFSESKVIERMPEETMKEINQSNLHVLKLQNRLSQMSIGTPDLALTHQASSVISTSASPNTNSRFFIIKSYTEEDLHKAVKYAIWSSTVRGNQVLDGAFKEVKQFR